MTGSMLPVLLRWQYGAGMRRAAMLVALLASSPAAAELRVSVAESAVEEAVAAGLTKELPEATVVRRAADADLQVVAVPDDVELAISVTTRDGAVLLSRRVPLDPKDLQPAVRVAVLLMAQTARAFAESSAEPETEAASPSPAPGASGATAATPQATTTATAAAPPAAGTDTPPPPPTTGITDAPLPPGTAGSSLAAATATPPSPSTETETATASASRWLVVRTGLTVGGWLRPATPLVGFFGGVGVRFDPFTVSVRGEIAGLMCCRLSDDRFDGDALEAALLAEARLRLARWGPVDFGAALAAGAAYVQLNGRPDDDPSFPVTLAEQTRSTWDPQGRLALGLEWPLWPDGLALSLWAGLQLRAARLVVDLPAREGDPPPVDAGVVLPWFALAASLPIL